MQTVNSTGINFWDRSDHAYLVLSRSHMESGLHGAKVGGGSGALVGSVGGVGQLGW